MSRTGCLSRFNRIKVTAFRHFSIVIKISTTLVISPLLVFLSKTAQLGRWIEYFIAAIKVRTIFEEERTVPLSPEDTYAFHAITFNMGARFVPVFDVPLTKAILYKLLFLEFFTMLFWCGYFGISNTNNPSLEFRRHDDILLYNTIRVTVATKFTWIKSLYQKRLLKR